MQTLSSLGVLGPRQGAPQLRYMLTQPAWVALAGLQAQIFFIGPRAPGAAQILQTDRFQFVACGRQQRPTSDQDGNILQTFLEGRRIGRRSDGYDL